jgi:peptide/nickel transport system substrate-binding protein
MEFGILGPLAVWRDGREVPIGAPKQRALLALLLLRRGELAPNETLIDELWGERPPATAAKALQVYVSQLRKVLDPGLLETRPAGYVLRVDPGALDAVRFEQLLVQGQDLLAVGNAEDAGTVLRGALGLWRGPPLSEFRYDEFARDEIARLEGLRLIALEQRLEADLGLGRDAEVVPELEALVREHPLRESLRALLMIALYRAGRQSDALAAYQDARTTLLEERGLDPNESLQQLETAILRHDPTLDLPRPAIQAPPPPVPPVPQSPSRTGIRRLVAVFGAISAAVAVTGAVVLLGRGGPGPASGGNTSLGANAVLAVDSSTRRVVGSAALGAAPGSIAYGEGSLWVAMPNQDSVSRVDPATNTVQQTIPVGKSPAGIAVGGGFVWVANNLDGNVSQIDPRANGGRVVNEIPVGSRPAGVAYGLGGLWVASSVDHTVVRIDPVTGAPGRPIPVDAGADAIAVGARAVWVTSESAGVLSRIDPRSGSAIPINVGNAPGAVAAGHGAVWVANGGDATVSRIDPATNQVKSLITVGDGPNGVAIAPGGRSVWVSNELAGTLSRIDPAVDKVDRTIPVGDLPQGVAAGPLTPYVAVRESGSSHRGGTLTLVVPNPAGVYNVGFPKSLDPAEGYTDWELLTLTNDGLVGYGRTGGAESYRVVPDLAVTLPTPSDGGRTYSFQLRRGIRYSTGAPVRPQDVRRGIERTLLIGGRDLPGSYLNGIVGAKGCVTKPVRCDLSHGIVTDLGSDTVTFHLTAPDPDFLYKLALPIADVVPASTPLRARLPLPATGPYEIAELDAKRPEQAVIRLVRNPHFHLWSAAAQPDGFPDQIIERFGYTAERAVNAVVRGTADITGDGFDYTWSPALTARLRTRYSSRLYHAPLTGATALWLNTRLSPFDHLGVRQALNYAADRDHLIELAGGPDVAQLSCQLLPPNTDGYRRYCPYTLHPNAAGTYNGPDLAKARRLVAASGTKGQTVTVVFYNVRIGLLNGAYFVSMLRSLGYNARLKLVPHRGSTWRPDRQAGVGGASEDFPSANDFFSPTFSCRAYQPARPDQNYNVAAFCNRHIDAEMARARALQTSDRPAASRLWAEIDRELTLQAPWVVIRTGIAPDFVSSRTGNYTACYVSDNTGSTGACLDQLWVR